MQSIALRTFSKLDYRDPRPFLVRLRQFELELSGSATPKRVRNLRTNQLKPERELREAAIFCYLAGQRMGTTVGLAPGEEQDYDFVAAWSALEEACFAPVQLKELPPEATAPAATLQGIISALGQYVSSRELVVAIHLNRTMSFDPSALAIPPLQIAELWAFGATSPDQNTWALWGDLLRSPTVSYHAYPAA
ncbi:hypothetical protein J2X20_002490 [Pelomonas saccharophila]|uniref:Uncharacterized protein n=1 Tax=Roseateles saccharophilus TaxID=304 RepID=A0ABU1YPF4_ROSSA|nr:hypothetical protein [Roseateles saccharophilus]MDR7269861.1 hypothetical protein [Roseateles saccharophilus]